MGFVGSCEATIMAAMAEAWAPPLPCDITAWCEQNVVFDESDPLPGGFRIDRFAWLREIHDVLSPEHPAREVTVSASAQIGKTISIINGTVLAWHASTALQSLVVHPTDSSAKEWVDQKFGAWRRNISAATDLFGRGGGPGPQTDTKSTIQTRDQRGSVRVTSAGSPNDLQGTTRRLVIMDDLSKWDMNDKGDPEAQAEGRAAAHPEAKILRVSTPMIAGTCRITRNFARSDRRYFHVPCPHCGHKQPLRWEAMKPTITPEAPHLAHFPCEACGEPMEHKHKHEMMRAGEWVPTNPRGDHPGFSLWRAYAPQRDWASIGIEYAKLMGWNQDEGEAKEGVAVETEQTFFNEVLGLPYELATGGQNWRELLCRVKDAKEAGWSPLPESILPALGIVLTAGVDCQSDRTEVGIWAWGRDRKSWLIQHEVFPHDISNPRTSAWLDGLLKREWRTELGQLIALDALAIDEGNWQQEVRAWAYRHSYGRVITVRGGNSETAPIMRPMSGEFRRSGRKTRRANKASWMANVSTMKADFYGHLGVTDPARRGFVHLYASVSEDVCRQLCSEVRITSRGRAGVMQSKWQLVEPGVRNEVLDCRNYAHAAAWRVGAMAKSDSDWDALDTERGAVGQDAQPELFDGPIFSRSAAPVKAKAKSEPPGDAGAFFKRLM